MTGRFHFWHSWRLLHLVFHTWHRQTSAGQVATGMHSCRPSCTFCVACSVLFPKFCMVSTYNRLLFIKLYGLFFPLQTKARVQLQPVNAWNPSNALQTSRTTHAAVSLTAISRHLLSAPVSNSRVPFMKSTVRNVYVWWSHNDSLWVCCAINVFPSGYVIDSSSIEDRNDMQWTYPRVKKILFLSAPLITHSFPLFCA